jgi:hypothetical protein
MIIFMDGFESYPNDSGGIQSFLLARWSYHGTNPTTNSYRISTSTRHGYGQALSLGSSEPLVYAFPTAIADTIAFGFAYKFANTSASPIYLCSIGNMANNVDHISLRFQGNSGLIQAYRHENASVLGTASVALTAGQWYWLDVKIKTSGTVGTVQVWLNGTLILDLSNVDTQNGASAQISRFNLGNSSSATVNAFFDDLYIVNCNTSGSLTPANDILGDCKVITLKPTGTTQNGWSKSGAATVHECIGDSSGFDGDSTYIYSASSTLAKVSLEDLPSGISSIKGVQITANARKDDAGSKNFDLVTEFNADPTGGFTGGLLDTYRHIMALYEKAPSTGNPAFTVSSINGLILHLSVS